MASRCACVMRGINSPRVVEVTSSAALAFGVIVPMPTWAVSEWQIASNTRVTRNQDFLINRCFEEVNNSSFTRQELERMKFRKGRTNRERTYLYKYTTISVR